MQRIACSHLSIGDAAERVEVLLVTVRQGVQVFLRGLDLRVTEALHNTPDDDGDDKIAL